MKKKYLIVLIVQSVLIVLMLVYSFIQKVSAEQQRQFAIEERRKADEIRRW